MIKCEAYQETNLKDLHVPAGYRHTADVLRRVAGVAKAEAGRRDRVPCQNIGKNHGYFIRWLIGIT
mgnify:CR=1 FL=1